MSQMQQRRLGRPPKAAAPGTRAALGLKVGAEVKARLDSEARRTGRTQSQVAELLIERALAAERAYGGAEQQQMVHLMAAGFIVAGQRAAEGKENWLSDPVAYGAGVAGVLDALLIGFPRGDGRAVAIEGVISTLLSRLAREKKTQK